MSPLGSGGRYTVTKAGVRLHYNASGVVDEAKNVKTGKVHTPAEFAADRKKFKKPKPGKGSDAHPGFAAVRDTIAQKSGISGKRAGAILANATRNASPAAKKKNPNLKRVK